MPRAAVVAVLAVAIAVSWLGARSPVAAAPGAALRWVWSGGVTTRSAVVTARVTAPGATVHLSVAPETAPDASARHVQATADADGAVRFAIDGLAPATAYAYRVSVDGALPLPGTFRTFGEGAWSFTVAFASCAQTGSRNAIFDTIRALRPDLFVHTGDFHYEDISRDDPAAYRQAYDVVLGSPVQGRLYRSVPVAYTWDDHDFGGNNATGTSRSRPAAQAVYRQFVPHYDLEDAGGGIHQAFAMGRVPVIVTDSRSARSSSRGEARLRTILGPRQRLWLKDKLTAAAGAPLVVWVNSVPWIARTTSGADNWGAYAAEREEIANHVAALGLTSRLLILSGDAHMVAIDDGSHSNYATGASRDAPGPVVVHAAPLDQVPSKKGGPYSHGTSRRRNQFGLLSVTDDGRVLTAEVSGRDRDGAQLPNMRIVLRCSDGRCEVGS